MKAIVVSVDQEVEVSSFVAKFNDDNNLNGVNELTVKNFLDFTGDSSQSNRSRIIS